MISWFFLIWLQHHYGHEVLRWFLHDYIAAGQVKNRSIKQFYRQPYRFCDRLVVRAFIWRNSSPLKFMRLVDLNKFNSPTNFWESVSLEWQHFLNRSNFDQQAQLNRFIIIL